MIGGSNSKNPAIMAGQQKLAIQGSQGTSALDLFNQPHRFGGAPKGTLAIGGMTK